MKVRCIKVLNGVGEEVKESPWITLNTIYDVIEISISQTPEYRTYLRLITENPIPAIYSLEQVELVDGSIPSNWIIQMYPPGTISLAPKPWLEPGFWERYFDYDPKAIKIYEEEIQKMGIELNKS
ncbi:MAG TPA: hypothetical protein VFT64_07540 [Rickettsiales bacterium]|nr:hypothetical protein [Rickettsiales bacterium]